MRGGVLLFLCKTFPIYPLNPYKTLKIPQNFRALRAKVEGGFYYFQDSEIQNLDRGFYYFQKFSNFGRGFLRRGVSIINSPVAQNLCCRVCKHALVCLWSAMVGGIPLLKGVSLSRAGYMGSVRVF